MTDVTTNSPLSPNYEDALQEAAEFLRTHKNKDELPVAIVVKAIGKKPPYCEDTTTETRDAFLQYRRDTQLLIERALKLATQ